MQSIDMKKLATDDWYDDESDDFLPQVAQNIKAKERRIALWERYGVLGKEFR